MKTIRLLTVLTVVFFATVANAQTRYKTEKCSPTNIQNLEISQVKANIAGLLRKETKIWDRTTDIYAHPKEIQVLDDRIEFMLKDKKTIIKYSDLLTYTIELDKLWMTGEDGVFYVIRYELNLGNLSFNYRMDYETGMQMTNNLFYLQKQQQLIQQQKQKNKFSAELELFKLPAAQYRELTVKPSVPEEQRRYIVQANGFNEQKNYDKAIELYKKAIETDQTAYPAAYSNLALLSAQVNDFDAAIYYMKKYLMLVPEADDARSAQDKIYLWEAELGK